MDDFKRRVENALRGELGDVATYTQLALQAPNPELRAVLQSIAADENGHARTFAAIVNLDPVSLVAPGVEGTWAFLDGIRMGLDGELRAVGEYAGLARMAPNPELRNLIMSIVADEFGHARTFAAVLALLSSRGLG